MSPRPADLVYRALLHALPADLRREFGEDMVQLFRDHRRAARGRPIALLRLWSGAIRDITRGASRRPQPGSRRPLRPGMLMRTFASDFRFGLRLLRRDPVTTAVAALTLALGIGASTAMFPVVDAVVLSDLPYPEPERLVMLWEKRPSEGVTTNAVSPADFLDWRRMSPAFAGMAAYTPTAFSLSGDGDAEEVAAAAVSWGFFDVLGVRPALGRTFRESDETAEGRRVLVMSHGLWLRRYGGDPGIVGRRILVSGTTPWEVIGVLPRDFQVADPVDLFAPLVLAMPGSPPPLRVSHFLRVYARLAPRVTLAQSVDAMDRLGRDLEAAHPDESRGHGAHVTSMREHFVQPVRVRLLLLSGTVGFVLLIACVNIASLLTARSTARRREFAVRAALGAGRGRLFSQTLAESLGLAVLGGVLGVAFAALLVSLLPTVMPARLSVIDLTTIRLDLRVLLFACAVTAATFVLVGWVPSMRASRPQLTAALRHDARAGAAMRPAARALLVIGEVALAALTLVGAGLTVRSFGALLDQPLGFEPANRLTFSLFLPRARYPTPDQQSTAFSYLTERLGALPGVASYGAVDLLPLAGGNIRRSLTIEGRDGRDGDPPTRIHPVVVTPGYLETMRIPIAAGRAFASGDTKDAEPVAIISATAARVHFPGEDPIGRRVQVGGVPTWRTIVGVAGDVRHWGQQREVNPMVYFPYAQAGEGEFTMVLRGADGLDVRTLSGAVRAAVAAFDPNLPVAGLRTLEEVAAASVRAERAQALLMGALGLVAVLLSAIGIYGVTARVVASRTREIGVRMALGARPGRVWRDVMAEGAWQVAAGLAIGLTAGVLLMSAAGAVLHGITPWDPVTISAAGLTLSLAAAAACVIPARRAMSVDPIDAIRDH